MKNYTEYTVAIEYSRGRIELTTNSREIWISCEANTLLNDSNGDGHIVSLTQWGTKGPQIGYDYIADDYEGGSFYANSSSITINAIDELTNFTSDMFQMFLSI